MKSRPLNVIARWYALVAGALDFSTGIALIAAPAFTLVRMGAAMPGAEALVYVRFAGVFVGAVGATYGWALVAGGWARLRFVFQVTMLFRGGAGIFTGIAVALGALDRGWLGVTATDLGFVAVQAWLLAKGVGRDE